MSTIKDIAKAAGVTYVTVSRALNDEPGVSEKTRQKIKALAEEMNYVPSATLAKRAAQRQSNTIGLIWPKGKGIFFYDLGASLQLEAAQRSQQIILSMASPEEALRTFNQFGVDSIMYWRDRWNENIAFLQELERFQGQMLLMGGARTSNTHSIVVNRVDAFRMAVHHLAELRHEQIAYIGRKEWDQFNGYVQGMAELKLDYRNDHVIHIGDEDCQQQLEHMLQRPDRPTAAILDCHGTFHLMSGVFKACSISIPEDMSVVVYDDTDQQYFDVPLTTVGPSIPVLARRAVDIVLRNPGGDVEWINEEMPSQLTIRSSTQERKDR